MGWKLLRGYSHLSDDEEFTDSSECSHIEPREIIVAPRSRWYHGILVVLIISNFALFGFSISNLDEARQYQSEPSPKEAQYQSPDLNRELKETSSYSPLLDIIDLRPTIKTFNGKLRDNTSIYRMPPSPEVDAAWDYISTEGIEAITVPGSAVLKVGKDPTMSVKVPPSWNGGSDAYLAQIDVFHQIHCLNELRKEINYDYYYGANNPAEQLHIDHKNHCIHMLLQNLMCHADVEVITHNWVHNDRIQDPKDKPFPDFNVVKQCRDFDRLLDWTRENAVKGLNKKFNALRIPPGMKVVPGDGYA